MKIFEIDMATPGTPMPTTAAPAQSTAGPASAPGTPTGTNPAVQQKAAADAKKNEESK